jgi:hypothetical protein
MKRLIIIVILFAIISFSTALYFLISHFTPRTTVQLLTPSVSLSPIQSQTPTQKQTQEQIILCRKEQLSASISPEGAAGNIYAKIEITNKSKTDCDVVLGNTIIVQVKAQNIIIHNQQTVPSEYFKLAPSQKIYSQVHYPNGPQCQTGVSPKQITFLYEIPQTEFTMELIPTQKMILQACTSQAEKTTIDIWPLSKNPITP